MPRNSQLLSDVIRVLLQVADTFLFFNSIVGILFMAVFRGKRISTKGDLNNKTAFVQVVLYNDVQSFYMGSPCSKIYVLQHPCQSACYKKSFKKDQKNSHIYLDVMDKLSTFAPALLERQSLMIDILLMIKGSENKNKKLRKKFGCYLKKSLSLHPLS